MSDVEASSDNRQEVVDDSMESCDSSPRQMEVSETNSYEQEAAVALQTNGDGEDDEEPVIDFHSSMTYWKQVMAERSTEPSNGNAALASPTRTDGLKSPPPPPTAPKPKTNTPVSNGQHAQARAPPVAPKPAKNPPLEKTPSMDVDVSSIPGLQPIPEGAPGWKKAMIEKKNKELIEKHHKDVAVKRAEEDKWAGIPAWKKNLMIEQEKKRQMEEAPLKEVEQQQQHEEARLQAMPAWKRDLLKKK